jgi:hypothetical protein
MNCISSFKRNSIVLLSLAWCVACGAPASESLAPSDPLHYRVDYVLSPDPGNGTIGVTLKLSQNRALLREMTMRPDSRLVDVRADGALDVIDGKVRWRPPAAGGTISWQVSVAHRRNGNGYDAWLGSDWGVFRAEDVIPRSATRTLKGSVSETWLTLRLPHGWSGVTQYFSRNDRSRIDNPERRFDQPAGWMVLGNLGIRRESIAGMRVAVAGPTDNSVRRMDTLALLNWTLPELARLLPELPRRLTIVSAGDPMWRGGLSAPRSLYVHADRPLISENATSTLLHEIMHLSLGLTVKDGYDWIVEGLAEYYSLELLHRSGTISDSRFARAKAHLANWASAAPTLCRQTSTGATTALAVLVFAALDEEISRRSANDSSLDDVLNELAGTDTIVDLFRLKDIAESLVGDKLDTLHIDNLPGCRNIAIGQQQT